MAMRAADIRLRAAERNRRLQPDPTRASDVLVMAVSIVLAPSIGHGILILLPAAGVLFGSKYLKSIKKWFART
jgi:hypothetical protein